MAPLGYVPIPTFCSNHGQTPTPVFRHGETCLARRRCLTHHLPQTSLVLILSARVPKTATFSQVEKGSGCKRSARGRVFASSVLEVRAILPSPLAGKFSFLVTLPNERVQGYDKLSRLLLICTK